MKVCSRVLIEHTRAGNVLGANESNGIFHGERRPPREMAFIEMHVPPQFHGA